MNKKEKMKENENLQILESLTKKLVPFKDIIKKETSDYVELEAENGSIVGFNLYKDKKVLVSRFLMTDGVSFSKHFHDGIYEILVVIEGELKLTFEDKEVILKERDSITIEPDVSHSGMAKGNTWVIAISMPPEPMFVNGDILAHRRTV